MRKKKWPKHSRGFAILMVMVSLALLMAIVTDLGTKETVRYKLALNERDALQAEALAQSGANFAKLILTVQEPLQKYLTTFASMGIQLPAYTVWEIMPINSHLLGGIAHGEFLPDFGMGQKQDENSEIEKREEIRSKKNITEKKVPLTGEYVAPEGGFGGFKGHFSALVQDEESKISIRNWAKIDFQKRKLIADQIFRILAKSEHSYLFEDNAITPMQVVGNLYDYISDIPNSVDVTAPPSDWGRAGSGDKKSIYATMPGITPKNAPFDSMAEMRLVKGITDKIYQVLAKNISVYSESEKINILSASDAVMGTIFFMCAKNKEAGPFQYRGFEEELVASWNRKKNEGKIEISAEGVMKHLKEFRMEVDEELCKKTIDTEAKTFTVESSATVGNVTKTIVVRLRAAAGLINLYQYYYL